MADSLQRSSAPWRARPIKRMYISISGLETYMSASDKTKQDFDEIDADGDGYITASEFLTASVTENLKISHDDIVKIITMADDDGDKKISYEEYVRFVR
jgi:Ca2+-binding EF-hand superfamily protein